MAWLEGRSIDDVTGRFDCSPMPGVDQLLARQRWFAAGARPDAFLSDMPGLRDRS